MDRVGGVDRECDRLAALAMLVPVRDDVADKLRPIHALGELVRCQVRLPQHTTRRVRASTAPQAPCPEIDLLGVFS
jgi:hypothetical protein